MIEIKKKIEDALASYTKAPQKIEFAPSYTGARIILA